MLLVIVLIMLAAKVITNATHLLLELLKHTWMLRSFVTWNTGFLATCNHTFVIIRLLSLSCRLLLVVCTHLSGLRLHLMMIVLLFIVVSVVAGVVVAVELWIVLLLLSLIVHKSCLVIIAMSLLLLLLVLLLLMLLLLRLVCITVYLLLLL